MPFRSNRYTTTITTCFIMMVRVLSYIMKLITKNLDCPNRTSHGRYNLVCPSLYNRETEGSRSFQVSGAKLWNSIPLDICKKESNLLSILSFIRFISVLLPLLVYISLLIFKMFGIFCIFLNSKVFKNF